MKVKKRATNRLLNNVNLPCPPPPALPQPCNATHRHARSRAAAAVTPPQSPHENPHSSTMASWSRKWQRGQVWKRPIHPAQTEPPPFGDGSTCTSALVNNGIVVS